MILNLPWYEWIPFAIFITLVSMGIIQVFDWIFPPPPKHDHPFPTGTITHAHECPKGQEFHTHDADGNFIPVAPIQQVQHYHYLATTSDLDAEVLYIEQETKHD